MTDVSDGQLVEECRRGDTAAFTQLVSRYQTLVCSIAYSITGDFARSEDVGQEAFIAAWRQLSELADSSRFKAWICSITRNLAHNTMRRDRKLEFSDASMEVADDSISPVEAAGQNEEQLLVWAALSRLPENYREPLVLFYRQDQSVNQVARSLDVTVDTAKQRLSRGRKLLRNEVLSSVERTLKRTTPTRSFTIAVVASLPAMATATATATASGSTATIAKAAIGTGAVKAGGILGAVFGGLVGLGGAAFGTWASWTTAEYQKQRDLIRRGTIWYLIGMTIFLTPFVGMMFGWRPQNMLGSNGYLIVYGAWMTFFMAANLIWMFWLQRAWHQITKQEQAAGAPPLPETRARRWISKWEGRRWRSRRQLLGLPLVDVAFSDPGAHMTASNNAKQGRARGWIALGDHARARLFAFGNLAIAPIAIGTMSFGLVSFGVLSVGLLSLGVVTLAVMSLGVMAFGVWSIGAAVAIGYLAAGPVAIAWEAAYGAVAIAFEFAGGSKAIAEHAADAAASRYFANSAFFMFASAVMDKIVAATRSRLWLWMLVIVVIAVTILLEVMYRRKPAG
jgi:RNA polymerase sigma factor (sigma-70 family)